MRSDIQIISPAIAKGIIRGKHRAVPCDDCGTKTLILFERRSDGKWVCANCQKEG